MCHSYCIKWGVEHLNVEEIRNKRVLEVGSYDVNGSYRYFVERLNPKEYIGVDIMEGPGVDLVCPAENLADHFGENYFDLLISTCTLEHVRDWKSAISNIKRVCKPNGIIISIAPSVWPIHEFPHDFWRYRKKDMVNIFSDCRIIAITELVRTPNLISLVCPKTALVYAKIRKPLGFQENNLSNYRLYSITESKRIKQIPSDFVTNTRSRHLKSIKSVRSGIISLFYGLQRIYLKNIYVRFLMRKYKGNFG